MTATALRAAARPRAFVGVTGPDATSYLQRMVSNDVEVLSPGEACQALLLTAKARVIAPLTILRRGPDDFSFSPSPSSASVSRTSSSASDSPPNARSRPRSTPPRSSSAARRPKGPCRRPTTASRRTRSSTRGPVAVDADRCRRARAAADPRAHARVGARARRPRAAGRGGLEERAISFTKGCYPGQEPVARLHYRGHPNRGLRVLALEGDELPPTTPS